MQTIKHNHHYEIIIKNSRFICYLYKINNLNSVESILNNIKKEEKDATHYCYAYIIDNYQKSSDDGEPSGTAGIPILKVLQNHNLNYVLAVVVRYFGGTLLGANGLIRAYTKSTTNAIDKDNLITLVKGYNLIIEFNYSDSKNIEYLLKDIHINNKEFSNTIKYNINIETSFLNTIINKNIKYQIIKEIYIEK